MTHRHVRYRVLFELQGNRSRWRGSEPTRSANNLPLGCQLLRFAWPAPATGQRFRAGRIVPGRCRGSCGCRWSGHSGRLTVRRLREGGTCVNFGCTPSKSLLRAARAVHQARDGQKFGYALHSDPRVDFAAVMTRVREMRAFSGSFDAVSAAAGAGIDVFLGDGRFVGLDAVEVA
jgi:hypothetical protein